MSKRTKETQKTGEQGAGEKSGQMITISGLPPADRVDANPPQKDEPLISEKKVPIRLYPMIGALMQGKGGFREKLGTAIGVNLRPEYRRNTGIGISGVVVIAVLMYLSSHHSAETVTPPPTNPDTTFQVQPTLENTVPVLDGLAAGQVKAITIDNPTTQLLQPVDAVQPTTIPEAQNAIIYTVQAGDNLFRLALNSGMTLDQFLQFNAQRGVTFADPSSILIGTQLYIVAGSPGMTDVQSAVVYSADVRVAPATGVNTSVERPVCSDPNQLGKDIPGTNTYCVGEGETLWSLAQRWGISVQALAAANGIADPSQPVDVKFGSIINKS